VRGTVGMALPRMGVSGKGAIRQPEPNWLMRNKLLAALLMIVLTVMSEPAYASLLPPEAHAFLHGEAGPAAFCLALVESVTAASPSSGKDRRYTPRAGSASGAAPDLRKHRRAQELADQFGRALAVFSPTGLGTLEPPTRMLSSSGKAARRRPCWPLPGHRCCGTEPAPGNA
jgi:hypothetical protein